MPRSARRGTFFLGLIIVAVGALFFAVQGSGQAATVGGGTHSLPHFTAGVGADREAHDLVVHVVNNSGLGALGAGGPADVQLFLFNNDGTPVTGRSGSAICGGGAACRAALQPGTSHAFSVATLAAGNAGGLDGLASGFAVITVTGAGAEQVAMEAEETVSGKSVRAVIPRDIVRVG